MAKRRVPKDVAEADQWGADALARANAANEKGDKERAERLYAIAEGWMAISNRMRGNGDGDD